jgi:Ca-activated chloride channel family protein
VDPAEATQLMKRELVLDYLRLRRQREPTRSARILGYSRHVSGLDDSGPDKGVVARLSNGRAGFETEVRTAPPSGSRCRGALAFFVVSAILLGAGPAAPEAWTREGAGQRAEAPRYPVDVRAVALDVLVTDREGRFVSGLRPDDFRVLEEGVPQQLSVFSPGRTPVTVIVLLDSSSSVRSDMLSIQKAAHRFIRKLAPGDRARIGFFHEEVVFGPRFTDDMAEHSAMINQMRPQRSTHLYDALIESFAKLERVPDRKALLVFSDGEDQGSRTSMQGALEAARQSDVSVYAIGILGWSADGGTHTNQELLGQIAHLTGGSAFFPGNEKEMLKAFDRIGAELHHQYRMGYVPAGSGKGAGQWREIQVELTRRKGLHVRCRRGYYSDRTEAP